MSDECNCDGGDATGARPHELRGEFKSAPWIVTLENANNGVILTDSEGKKQVFVTDDSMGNKNPDALVTLLYQVLEALGEYGDLYAKETVEIRITHGRKYNCKDNTCGICEDEHPMYVIDGNSDSLHMKMDKNHRKGKKI